MTDLRVIFDPLLAHSGRSIIHAPIFSDQEALLGHSLSRLPPLLLVASY
jgi:hypothetical protein